MTSTPYVSLADFASTFAEQRDRPYWSAAESAPPVPLDSLRLRAKIEDVVDTVVALQRAEWLQDGVYCGPTAAPDVYRDVLSCARTLQVSVPPAILTSGTMKTQGTAGTDARPFLVLSSYFFQTASIQERRFIAGRLCGHIALRQVTAMSTYGLVADHTGLRSAAKKAVGPLLEVVLAPIGLGVKLAMSRWHRAAELSADRAGLICCGSLDDARNAMLRISLAVRPQVDAQTYLDQLRAATADHSPGRWTELLASEPWMHKRMMALEHFANSQLYAELSSTDVPNAMTREALEAHTRDLLGVG